jgi:hypothetical protein
LAHRWCDEVKGQSAHSHSAQLRAQITFARESGRKLLPFVCISAKLHLGREAFFDDHRGLRGDYLTPDFKIGTPSPHFLDKNKIAHSPNDPDPMAILEAAKASGNYFLLDEKPKRKRKKNSESPNSDG